MKFFVQIPSAIFGSSMSGFVKTRRTIMPTSIATLPGWSWASPQRALDDLNKVIELAPEPVAFILRGEVYRFLREYEKAVVDYAHAEALDPDDWQDNGFYLLYQADAHAHLGNEAAALACCARLPDDFWTPGMNNTPGGGKAEIAEKLRRIAVDAQQRRV